MIGIPLDKNETNCCRSSVVGEVNGAAMFQSGGIWWHVMCQQRTNRSKIPRDNQLPPQQSYHVALATADY